MNKLVNGELVELTPEEIEEVNASRAAVEIENFNESVKKELLDLDDVVSRAKEDKASNLNIPLDPVEAAVVEEKKVLRSKLK